MDEKFTPHLLRGVQEGEHQIRNVTYGWRFLFDLFLDEKFTPHLLRGVQEEAEREEIVQWTILARCMACREGKKK